VLHYINKFNPITYMVTVPRDWFTGLGAEYLSIFLFIAGLSVAILLLAWILYRIAMPILIERVGA